MHTTRRNRRQWLLRPRDGDPPAVRQGFSDFVILERADDVGGTWRDNSYPGCACDVRVASLLPVVRAQPRLDRSLPRQAEIWRYLQKCADDYGLRRPPALEHEVRSAGWLG